MGKRPGGELANRPLHFIWIADCSGSMQADGKIQALNQAIREALPHMRSVANENPRAKVLIRALRFSDRPEWNIPSPTPVEDFKWVDLKAGANPSAPDRDGLTPLHHAAYLGLDKIGKRLLEMRAKANIQGRQGWTPLHEAAYSGKLGFCKLLLSYGADPNIENNSGNKPLHLAYYQNRKECANLLRPLTRSISLGQSAAPGDQGPAGTVDEPGRSGKLGR